jgi:hypothetical protein
MSHPTTLEHCTCAGDDPTEITAPNEPPDGRTRNRYPDTAASPATAGADHDTPIHPVVGPGVTTTDCGTVGNAGPPLGADGNDNPTEFCAYNR